MSILSVGMAFCDIPLRPCPANVMEMDNCVIDPVELHTGGDALTVAVVLSKMGEDVTLVAHLGQDANGNFVRQELEKNKVRTDRLIDVSDYSTATSYQLIEENGQRHFVVDNRILSLLRSKDVKDSDIAKNDLVFFGSALCLSGMDDENLADLFKRTHDQGKLTAMDASVGVRDTAVCKMDLLRKTLQYTDIFIPSYEEASYLAQKTEIMEIMDAFKGFPMKVFGIKLGGDGCILTEDFEHYVKLKPYNVEKVVDTTGAGDCFMGGFLCAYLKGWSLEDCGKFASAVSAFGISAIGATTAVPDFAEVYRYMSKYSNANPLNTHERFRMLFESLKYRIEQRSKNNIYTAMGYGSNLDLICDFDVNILNRLLAQHMKGKKIHQMSVKKMVCTLDDLLETIVYFCAHGIGGEVDIEDPELVKQYFPYRNGMGGTPVQAALALAEVGGESLVHLTDDSKEVCDILKSPYIKTVDQNMHLISTGEVKQTNPQEVHIILQFKKGDIIKLGEEEAPIPCSNRLILTKNTVNEYLPLSQSYFQWIEEHADQVSSNVLSGFNSILDPAILKLRLEYIKKHLEIYHRNNPDGIVYFEDAHYHDAEVRRLCNEIILPHVDIVSMNEEELQYTLKSMYSYDVDIDNILSCVEGVEFLLKKYGSRKGIIVHTKEYAMFVGDPGKTDIGSGLVYGVTMATAKACFGCYGNKEQLREILNLELSGKGLLNMQLIKQSQYADRVIIVPTRYIDKPKYTIGLGDSFTGGVQMCF